MQVKKGINIIVIGSMITFATFSSFPLEQVYAEENVLIANSTKLSALEIVEFKLDQPFSSDIGEYTATVSNEMKTMNILLNTETEGAVVAINGEEVESNKQLAYSLETGENVFAISITNDSEVSSYSLTVVREQNDNSSLSNLTLSEGKINFSSAVKSYSVDVANAVRSLIVTPTTAVGTSTVNVNGTKVDSNKGVSINLPEGESKISIVVTAEDGSQTTYSVAITRKEETNNDTSTNESTSSTSKEQQTGFSAVSTSGTNSSRSSSSDLVNMTGSTITGSTSSSLKGESTGEDTSTTANLSALSVTSGTWNKSFDPDTYTYHIAVATDISSVTISAAAEYSGAKVEIEDGTSTTVSLPDQAKTAISIKVSNDNDRKTYVLVFDKDIEEDTTSDAITVAETTSEVELSETPTGLEPPSDIGGDRANKEMTATNQTTSESSNSFWNWVKSLFTF
ncbi:cadherin-like beta sandwich domain-containing protein [Bacillus sp. AFS040349]|uniref:cadherin-like beta sandwich domain-containing protein n=1 Tax=Bacillus sp. AFS040349 TaxID=2033502 RepID=UPI000BFD2FBB|nr:cadherin-like beta sandwich domain-containing protein [Bacillus sp. AFS040349]PGT84686.1 hypothetical protein COD11_10190 [Bacillus sp. AFS040349]